MAVQTRGVYRVLIVLGVPDDLVFVLLITDIDYPVTMWIPQTLFNPFKCSCFGYDLKKQRWVSLTCLLATFIETELSLVVLRREGRVNK